MRTCVVLFIFALFPLNSAIAGSYIAENVKVVDPTFFKETCSIHHPFAPSRSLVKKEGRLIAPLRRVAKRADPLSSLLLSAKSFALQNPILGRAFADLSVTGRTSFKRFQLLHASGVLTEDALVPEIQADPALKGISAATLYAASTRALDRAYQVANALPYGNSPERADLGWIAVSGEDDRPYRPVNVHSTEYPQYDITVKTGATAVTARYMIAESLTDPKPPAAAALRTLPQESEPVLSPDAKVLLFIPGMDSRLEEAMALFYAIRKIGQRTHENWTILSLDMPSSGYSDSLDPNSISPIAAIGRPRAFPPGFNARGFQNVPILDFQEQFIVDFINALDQKIPVKAQLAAIIGGSFGGNMTFRLGRRKDLPWLKNVVSWSPASIWQGLADGASIFKQLGVAAAWKRAGGAKASLSETPRQRSEFFKEAFDDSVHLGPITIVPAQPEQWFRSDWPCRSNLLQNIRMQRWETYDRNFRLWHWRLGAEQLIFSQQKPPNLAAPRYLENHIRMLLAAGEKDSFHFTDISSATLETAQKMTRTPGYAVFIKDTGHSIHEERPNFWAAEIVAFLKEHSN